MSHSCTGKYATQPIPDRHEGRPQWWSTSPPQRKSEKVKRLATMSPRKNVKKLRRTPAKGSNELATKPNIHSFRQEMVWKRSAPSSAHPPSPSLLPSQKTMASSVDPRRRLPDINILSVLFLGTITQQPLSFLRFLCNLSHPEPLTQHERWPTYTAGHDKPRRLLGGDKTKSLDDEPAPLFLQRLGTSRG